MIDLYSFSVFERFCEYLFYLSLPPGFPLIKINEEAKAFFVILSGEVEIITNIKKTHSDI